MNKFDIDIVSRKTAERSVLEAQGNTALTLTTPSVVEIHGQAKDVVNYVRQGKDLLIYMKDGSVIRCNGYFIEDEQSHAHSELVFNDNNVLTHITFDDVAQTSELTSTTLVAHSTPIESIEPLLAHDGVLSDVPWGWVAGAAVGGGVIGALLSSGGGHSKTKVIDNTQPVETAKPTFNVADTQGDKQGLVTANATIDDNTPTFSGSGQPGATIQIKDADGSTIASAMVDSNGAWSVKLPTQTDGAHSWSVTQINGSSTSSAGSINVTIDTSKAQLVINKTASDDILNAAEHQADVTVSGLSQHLPEGTAVTISLNGKDYSAVVDSTGQWSAVIPAADAQALADGVWTVTATAIDATGNQVSQTQQLTVDTQAPTLTLDAVSGDQVVNAAEHQAAVILSGSTTAETGQIVTVTLGNASYQATVDEQGLWQVSVPAEVIKDFADGDYSYSASVSDKAGNTSSATGHFIVDATAPVVTIDTFAGDDVVNAAEHQQAQVISGSATGAASGDKVVITLNGQTYTTVVDNQGHWSIGVPSSAMAALTDGTAQIDVSVTDAAGNTGNATHQFTVDTAEPTLSFDVIAQDNVINATEKTVDLTLTGQSSHFTAGTPVTVQIAGKTYTATTNEQGEWSVTVPAQDLAAFPEGQVTVTASATNESGNVVTENTHFTLDTHLPVVSINSVAGDDVINASELAAGQTLSGKVSGAAEGDTVTVKLGGQTYTTTVGKDLSWSVQVPTQDLTAFGNGDLTVTATVTNQVGNTGVAAHDFSIDANLPGLRVNTVAGDDIINTIEHGQNLIVTGSSQGLAADTALTVTINGKDYAATVLADGSWSAAVPAEEVTAWGASTQQIAVSGNSSAGNPVAILHPVTVDLADVAISINTVSGDDVINATEKGQDLVLSGETHDVEAGSTVTVQFAGHSYTTTVDSEGKWTYTVPAGDVSASNLTMSSVEVSVVTPSGNTAQAGREVHFATQAPSITINNLTQDNVLNAQEAGQDQLISGSSTAQAGQTVTVSVNGQEYQTTVDSQGQWQVTVPAADLAAFESGKVTIEATVADKAGNSASANHVVEVDLSAPVVTIDKVAGDDIININEHQQAQIISGKATGAEAGNSVVVTIAGQSYTTVLDASGNWSVGVPATVISALQDGKVSIDVNVTDNAGNVGSKSHEITVDTGLPSITINPVTSDNVINAAEKGENLTLSGSTSHVEPGNTVVVKFAGQTYSVVVDAKGGWTLYVPASALAELKEGTAQVQVSVSNDSGNDTQASLDYQVDSSVPMLHIDPLSDNNVLNAAEAQQPLTITGSTAAEAGQTVTVTFNDQQYTATVQADGTWSLTVPADDLASLKDATYSVAASVSDKAGNGSTASLDLLVDVTAPTTTIATLAGDDTVNQAEHSQALVIQGNASGTETGDIVTVALNGKTYNVVVDAQGAWSLGIPASDVAAMGEGDYTVTATVTDKAGNSTSTTHDLHVDFSAPVLTIDTIAGDDIINSTEKSQDLTITGKADGLQEGQSVTVTLNGQAYTATVDAQGNWSAVVPADDVKNLGEAGYTVTASATNDIGNQSSASHAISVGAQSPMVSIDTVAGDDVINASELAAGQTLSGKVGGADAGDTVTISLGGKTYTAIVATDFTWSVKVPSEDLTAFGNGELTVTASVTNQIGNTGTATHEMSIDANLPGLRVNTVAGDDIINTIEHGQNLIVTGSSQGLAADTALTVTINGKDYAATVLADGSWSTAVPADDVTAWSAGTQQIAVSGNSSAGNPVTILHPVTVDLADVAISIDTVSGDDVINAAEKGQDIVLSGTTHDVEAGSTVTVKFAGHSYTTSVDGEGNWSYTVPAADLAASNNGMRVVDVSVVTPTGNTAQAGREVHFDTQAPSLTINNLTQDNVLNANEAGQDQLISGSSTAQAGQTVTITLNGQQYQTTVDSQGQWQVSVPAADLAALQDGQVTIEATVADKAGNSTSVEHAIAVDQSAPVITVNTVAGDDIINIDEHQQAQVISGQATGGTAGNSVVVTIAGQSYTTVLDASGNWSIGVPASVISALQDGKVSIDVNVTDSAGNVGTGSHQVTVDTGLPSIAINPVTSDNVINAAEKAETLILSGTTAHIEAGKTVTVNFAGHSYTTTVDEQGQWSVEVPAVDLSSIKDGSAQVLATVSNDSGNGAQASLSYEVDSSAPIVRIDPLSDNNVLNLSEAQQPLAISGSSTAEAGQTVTVTFNDQQYTAIVQADGTWSLTVPAEDLASLTDATYSVAASVSDKAGNASHTSADLLVDVTAPTTTIATLAGDDVINQAEHGQALIIAGNAEGTQRGDLVTVALNGKTYTVVVDEQGAWSLGVSANDVAAMVEGDYTVTATVTDKAGNSSSTTHDLHVDLSAPVLSIDTIAGDDIINSTEKSQDLTITGKADGLQEGQSVTVTLNGQAYTATVDAQGNWSAVVPADDVKNLGEAGYSVTASATNDIGNHSSVSHAITVGSQSPLVTIDTVAGDNVINASELAVDQTLSGKVGGADVGDTVTITLGGKTYTTTVNSDLTWSTKVPTEDLAAFGNGALTVTASVTNHSGNTGVATHDISIDANLPGLRVNTVAGDDIINTIEHGQNLIVTGSSQGLTADTALTVTINGKDYAATVLADGSWSTAVPADDVTAWSAGTQQIAVSGSSSAGNPVTILHPVTIDLADVAISIDTVSGDDVINAAEKGQDVVLSGTTHDVEAGSTVTVKFGGNSYTTNVDSKGNWSYTVPAGDLAASFDGINSVQVSVVTPTGNTAQAGREVNFDSQAPSLTINNFTSDNVLNANEAGQDQLISGSSTAQAGQTVTVSLNGQEYQTTVNSQGQWQVTVPAADLAALQQGQVTIEATVADKAGNSASTEHAVEVNLSAPVITVNTVAGDDIINIDEHQQAQIISGQATGGAAGNSVVVTIAGQSYTTVLDASGNWSVGVPASVISALQDGKVSIDVSVTDSVGNVGTGSHQVTVDTGLPSIAIDPVTSDNVINAAEKAEALTLSGTTTHIEAGKTVTVNFAGHSYTTTVGEQGQWSVNVPAADLGDLKEGTAQVQVSVSNDSGNGAQASLEYQVDTYAPMLHIDPLSDNNILNAAEAQQPLTITGSSTAEAGQTVTVTFNDQQYTATVQADGTWSLAVPADDLASLTDATYSVSAAVADKAGNGSTSAVDLLVDVTAPTTTIATLAGDDVINQAEHGQALIIQGNAEGTQRGDLVTVALNGKTYTVIVDAQGAWSLGIPASDVATMSEGDYTVTATVTDNAGNSSSTTHDLHVDFTVPVLTINTVAGDDIINSTEKTQDLTVTGKASGLQEGASVTVSLNGHDYTATVDAKGNWSAIVPAADIASLGEAAYTVTASATNDIGNASSVTHAISVGAESPLVTINTVAGDDVINASELAAGQTLSGKVSGAAVGDNVTVTVGGQTYTTTVNSDLTWSVKVPSADLTAFGNGELTVTASVTNQTGNTGEATHDISIDANLPGLRVNTVAGDDIINTIEHGQNLIVTGSSQGLAADTALTVTINGKDYAATVLADGSWSAAVPANDVTAWSAGAQQIAVSGNSSAGNPVTILHPVTVDLADVAISIDTVSGDDVINAAEKGQDVVLSGQTQNVEEGSTVTVKFAGHSYTTSVDSEGKWSYTVPADDLAANNDGSHAVDVSVVSASGNMAQAGREVQFDTLAPSLTINNLTQDNVLNAKEAGQDQLISGSSTAQAGQTVTVSLNGQEYQTTVNSQGQWQVTVPAADLAALQDGQVTIEATVADKAGNSTSAEHAVEVDLNAPVITVNTVAGDDIINIDEHQQAQIISGQATGGAVGNSVVVTIAGQSYTTVLDASGNWSVGVPASIISALQDGKVSIDVSVTDSVGNIGTASHQVTVDSGLPSIAINSVTSDNVINAAEKAEALTLSGTTAHIEAGKTVTVSFAGHSYTTTVDEQGQWSIDVPAADLSGLKEGTAQVQVSVSNDSGNTAQASLDYQVDTVAPALSIDAVTADNVINAAEAKQDITLTGSSSAGEGQTVTLSINGQEYRGAIDDKGQWHITLPAADAAAFKDGSLAITATVSDAAGNSVTVDHTAQVDLTSPEVTIDTVAGDDIISLTEHSQAQIISGTATGAAAGDKVSVTIDGHQYTTVLDAEGNWSVGVPAKVVSALQDGSVTITATVTDAAGNVGQQTHDVVVNSVEVALSIDTIAQDDVINAAEAGQDLTITGASSHFASGTDITITLNSQRYTATIDDQGHWQVTVPAADVSALNDATNYVVTVSAADGAGNNTQASHSISIDTTAPVISINTIAGDDVLNAAEQQQPLTLTGSTTAQAGQTVTVSVGDNTYTTEVKADGSWQLTLTADELTSLGEGVNNIAVSVKDTAGNEGQAQHDLTVDTQAPTITIDKVASDDVVNSDEQKAGQTITGTATAEAGQQVTLTFNGHSYTATVDEEGKWSVAVTAHDLVGLTDGEYTLTAVVADKAGNPGQTSHTITLSGDVPTITIDTFAADDVVNAAEHNQPLEVSGTTTAPAGQTVSITLNGKTYSALVDDKGAWHATISSADVAGLADGQSYTLHAEVKNSIGNSAAADHTVNVDLTAPSMDISIDALQNDTGLSNTDFITQDAQVVLNGKLSAALANDEHAEISLDGGITWQTLTVTGTDWSFSDGRTLADGDWKYQVRVIDDAGNVGSTAQQTVVVDTTAPAATSMTIDAITQDTGLSDSDFITSDQQISLTGTLNAELGKYDHAQISLDGGATWTEVSVSGSTWTYVDSRTLTDGKYNYQVRVIDDAGNIAATASQVVTIDSTVPDASKTITIDSIDQDTGLHSDDFITNDNSLVVKGSLGASLSATEYAQISLDKGATWQNVNVIGTQWNFTDGRTLADGNYEYWVRVVDAAGNVGAFTHQVVTVDTVAPDVDGKITVNDITVDSGFDNHDFLTNQTSYTLEGSIGKALQANEYVQVSMDGGKTWVFATVDGTSWSYADSRTLTDGQYNYQIRVIDEAGNIGSSTTQKVTVDTTAPDYGISIDAISDDTGQSTSDFITMDQTLTITGSIDSALASDERVQISLDGGNTWIDTTVTNKQWSYADTRTLADGDYTYQVRIIDQAGNVGSTTQQVVTVDTTAPISHGTVVSYTDDQGERQGDYGSSYATDDTKPVINGTLSQSLAKGDIVQLFRDGVLLGLVNMTDNIHWTYQDSNLTDGKHNYFVRVTDLAGNYNDSQGFTLKVDTTVPTTTASINPETTTDTTPIINGTISANLENGEYLVITLNGKTYTSEEGGGVIIDQVNKTWYLQVPDSDALALNSYDLTAQIKSSAGNGNTTGLTDGSLVVNSDAPNTDWATVAGVGNNSSMLLGINSKGLWNIGANGQIYMGTDSSSFDDNKLTNTRGAALVNMTGADVNRSGVMSIYGTETDYGGSTQITWTYDGSSYNGSQLAMGTTIYYGGVMAYDRTGDGYLDLAYGDAGMDSLTYLVNKNGTLTPDGTGGESSLYGQFDSGREISGVDLNNDGTVDIVQHTNRSGAYTLTVINNIGDGTLKVGQDVTNVFVGNGANSYNAASMTWADFNGDGYMDLFIGSGSKGNAGLIYYNDGTGKLATTGSAVESTGATQGYLSTAVDWNGDGQMDVVKFSTYGGAQTATLFTNTNQGASWAASNLASKLVNVTGIAAMDYDWNGTQDLLVSQQNGKVVLIQNNNEIKDGTAVHLRIVDSEGINVFYGNTVNLYNSAGKLVASQIINAQSGIGVNDTSALVSFYGLNSDDTYTAQLVKITNGKSDNVSWDNLEAGNGKEGYVLTADSATGGHSGTLTGTGYNDTFVAEEGSYTYNGGGGWTNSSDHDNWSNTGGVDVVDYRNATAAVNVDLSISSAQDTGFNTSRLVNIEGINGSDFNDVITGSKGDNQFNGRGGNDTFNIGNGGHDTMLYKLIDSADATGGNGSDVVNGFTVGSWEATADTDRIDLRELLSGSSYKGTGSASYVDGVATIDASAGNITDYLHVVQNGSNTEIQIDRDGTGSNFDATTVVTLNGVQTDLATLLANHQLLVV